MHISGVGDQNLRGAQIISAIFPDFKRANKNNEEKNIYIIIIIINIINWSIF